MVKRFSFIIFAFTLILQSTIIWSQNSAEFFKTIPIINDDTPDWAKMMYSDNPNVFEVDESFKVYYKNNEFIKDIHTQNYKHWRWQVTSFIGQEGLIERPGRLEDALIERKLKLRLQERANRNKSRTPDPDWHCIGPFETYFANESTPVSWHKNIYSMDQSASDPNLLIAGTEAGGIYKSTDKGLNWSLITKNEIFVQGNTAVKIHPTNPDFFLVASNNRIYRSLDGGSSWSEVHYLAGSGYEFKFDPSNSDIIYSVGSSGLFKSIDGGNTWSQLFSQKCWDLDFHPTNPDIIYLLRSNTSMIRSELYRSDNGGNSWTLKDNGFYIPSDPANAIENGAKIGVTPAAPDYVYVCLIGTSKVGDDGWIGVYKSTNMGDSWVNPAGQDGGPYGPINGTDPWNVAAYSGGYHQGWFNFDLEVSDNDPEKLWIATIRLTESTDGGATFTSIGAADSQRLSEIHADVQDLEVNGSDIWVATDGGLNFSTDELMTHESRKKGIQASHFWGFNTGWNQDSYTGGRYHDGTIAWYENYPEGTVFNIGGVEEPSGYVHPVDGRKMYFRRHYSSSDSRVRTIPDEIAGTTISHASIPLYPNESYYSSSSSGIYFDHRYADHLLIGKDNILYKSIDAGANFDTLYAFPASGSVFEFEQSRDDYNFLFVVFKPDGTSSRVIYKSTDGGHAFTQMNNVPGNRTKIEISLNPADNNEIWVGLGNGYDGSKVFRSIDGGQNWTNMSTAALNGESIQDIRFQGGTDDLVYLASYNTVFYYDSNLNDWIEYGDGLPLIAKSLKLNPFYRDGALRLGTSGRGVFGGKMADTLFSPIAQPISYSDQIYCKNDTAQFDCYSILKHQGASWEWSFSPEPAYVEASNIRNPKVVFGAEGYYDVSLTVTNSIGQSDTRNLTNMIFVSDKCAVDTIPGRQLQMQDNNDYVQISDLGLNAVDTLTITAWVKPQGIQDDYTGIVMNDDQAAGFNFANGDNTLRYHWPGGQWWWNSGLIVAPDVWSHVAMVATDDQMRVFVNGEEAIHNIDLDPVDMNSLKIGSYKGWTSRNMRGFIDEVGIWTRALSKNEIQDFRHLTKEDTINDPFFVAYYQFNEPDGSPVFDKTLNGNNAFLMNGAGRTISDTPVGGGKSQRLLLDGAGEYYFDEVGIKMILSPSGDYPNGDVVISRLNILPDETVDNLHLMYDDYYWIINNYGTNQSFTEPDSLWFEDLNFVYEEDGVKYYLFSRSENDSGSTWASNTIHDDALNGVYSKLLYVAGTSITSSCQILIEFSNEDPDIIWNGKRWYDGSGMQDSPGLSDVTKNVYIMPGNPAFLLESAACRNIIIYENGEFVIPEGLLIQPQN